MGIELNPATPRILIPGDEDQERGYKICRWRGHLNYVCIYCQFATLWLHPPRGVEVENRQVGISMEEHQAHNQHPWAYPGQNPEEPEQEIDLTDPEY